MNKRKYLYLIIALAVILLITLCISLNRLKLNDNIIKNTQGKINNSIKKNKIEFQTFELICEVTNEKQKKLLISKGEFENCNSNIYLYGIDKVYIKDKQTNRVLTLRDSIQKNFISLNLIREAVESEASIELLYLDGGSMQYRLGEISLIFFNTELENTDVYFCSADTNLTDID